MRNGLPPALKSELQKRGLTAGYNSHAKAWMIRDPVTKHIYLSATQLTHLIFGAKRFVESKQFAMRPLR